MHITIKLAYYGYIEFFNYNIVTLSDKLVWAVNNGCFKNEVFFRECYRRYPDDLYCLEIMAPLGIMPEYIADYHIIFFNFSYPSKDICFKLIKQEESSCGLGIVSVIKDWKDVYNAIEFEKFDYTIYNIARYLKKDYYMKKQLELPFDNRWGDQNKYLNMPFHESCLHYFIKNHTPLVYNEYEDEFEYWKHDFEKNNLKTKKFITCSKVNYRLDPEYCKGVISNVALSKIISTDLTNFTFFEKHRPFLLYTGSFEPSFPFEEYAKIEPLLIYNLIYIKTINSYFDEKSTPDFLPEYNLYVLSLKLEVRELTANILKKYEKHGKLYKIMDLENECYYKKFEEIYELPQVNPINLENGEFLRL